MNRAKAALAQSAYPKGGVSLLFLIDSGLDQSMEAAQLFKAALAEINVTLNPRFESSSVIASNAVSKNPPQAMYMSEWAALYPGDVNLLQMFYQSKSFYNYSYYANPEVDKLIAQAEAAEATDLHKSAEICAQATKIASASYPYIWACVSNYRAATAKNVVWPGYDPLNPFMVSFYDVQMD